MTLAVARAARVPGRYADGGGGLYLNFTATGAMLWLQRIVDQGRRRDFELGFLDEVRPAAARKTGLLEEVADFLVDALRQVLPGAVSLRTVVRMLERAEAALSRPLLQ